MQRKPIYRAWAALALVLGGCVHRDPAPIYEHSLPESRAKFERRELAGVLGCEKLSGLSRTDSYPVIVTMPPIYQVRYEGEVCGKAVDLLLECSDTFDGPKCEASALAKP